jgi:hypothetical protein
MCKRSSILIKRLYSTKEQLACKTFLPIYILPTTFLISHSGTTSLPRTTIDRSFFEIVLSRIFLYYQSNVKPGWLTFSTYFLSLLSIKKRIPTFAPVQQTSLSAFYTRCHPVFVANPEILLLQKITKHQKVWFKILLLHLTRGNYQSIWQLTH